MFRCFPRGICVTAGAAYIVVVFAARRFRNADQRDNIVNMISNHAAFLSLGDVWYIPFLASGLCGCLFHCIILQIIYSAAATNGFIAAEFRGQPVNGPGFRAENFAQRFATVSF